MKKIKLGKIKIKKKNKENNANTSKKGKVKSIVLSGILICGIAVISIALVFALYIIISSPDFDQDKLYSKESSVLYYADGVTELARLGAEDRVLVTYDDLPQVLVDAIVATEDSRFFQHKGMDVARFNFSHSTHKEHKELFDTFVAVRDEIGKPVAALLDTKGPEIRLRRFREGSAELKPGDSFILTTDDIEGDNTRCSITYSGLPGDVSVNSKILIDDGLIELKVEKVTGEKNPNYVEYYDKEALGDAPAINTQDIFQYASGY